MAEKQFLCGSFAAFALPEMRCSLPRRARRNPPAGPWTALALRSWAARPDATPGSVSATVRRYRCAACGATQDVSPPGLAKRLCYSLPAIASALFLWAFEQLPANYVRKKISPHVFAGLNQAQRWRSLIRWSLAAPAIFGFDKPLKHTTHRQEAERAARWIRSTRPPQGSERERIFLAAQVF